MNPEWFYSNGDERLGPVTEDQLRELIANGTVKPRDLVWKDGMADWVEVRSLPTLLPNTPEPAPSNDPPEDRRQKPLSRVWDQAEEQERRDRQEREDREERRSSRRERNQYRSRDAYDDRDDSYDDRDDYDDGPRRRRGRGSSKPGQITTVGILLLVGGILGIIFCLTMGASSLGLCCVWPGLWFELVMAILMIIRGVNMLNADEFGPPTGLAVCQICFILNLDVVNMVLGIVALCMIGSDEAKQYYRRRGFN